MTATAPAQGHWGYRIFILNSKNQTLTLRGHWLYAYKNISLGKFLSSYENTPGTIAVGSRLLAYNAWEYRSAMDLFTTTRNGTCRSISLQLGRLPYYSSDADSSHGKTYIGGTVNCYSASGF